MTWLEGRLALVMELLRGSLQEWMQKQFEEVRTVAELHGQLVDIAHQIAMWCLAMSEARELYRVIFEGRQCVGAHAQK